MPELPRPDDPTVQLPKPNDTRTIRHGPGPDAETVARASKGAPVPEHTFEHPRYDLRDELGRGGMGVVYRARDRTLGRDVALKVLGVPGDAETVKRFAQEAKVTAQLEHPAVIPIHDLGTTPEGLLFYTMRCIDGHTLTELLEDHRAACWGESPSDKGGWSFFRLLQVFVTVCRAVASAHSRDVIHRDLKPSNVMVGRFGQVYVLDWGLAKVLNAPAAERTDDGPRGGVSAEDLMAGGHDTMAGVVVGTPAFMSPEQARGVPVGPPADVYALGGLLFVLLTGAPPRPGASAAVLLHLARGEPARPPTALRKDIPDALELPCLAAMSVDPAKRPTANELADAVEDYLEGRNLQSAPPEEASFLRSYSSTDFRRPSVAVDVVVLRRREGGPLQVLLQRRAKPPFAGHLALPGTFVKIDETLEAATLRLLRDECGTEAPERMTQAGLFDEVGRDPRTRVITVLYRVEVDPDGPDLSRPEEEVRWHLVAPEAENPLSQLEGPLAFDHETQLRAALELDS